MVYCISPLAYLSSLYTSALTTQQYFLGIWVRLLMYVG